jgi:hypothetical protein
MTPQIPEPVPPEVETLVSLATRALNEHTIHAAFAYHMPHATTTDPRRTQNTKYAANSGYADAGAFPCSRPVGLVLVANESAVNIFGLATRYTARAWLPQVEHATEEVAVELASRALKTTGLPGLPPHWTELEGEDIPLIKVWLRLKYPSLFIEVWDGDRASPFPAEGSYLDDYLAAVHERAQRWDWFPRGPGKVIWAELGIPPQPHTDPLPHRPGARISYPAPMG